jgi:hypothetical protein
MVWFLGWVAHALAHDQNPFLSKAILLPGGVNLAENTSMPLLGALFAPITLLFGPVVSANLLMVLAMPMSASAAFMVLRKWEVWRPAAALAGLIYGFSPYMVGESLGHLSLVFLPLPPLIALTVVSIAKKQGSPLWLGTRLGLLVTAQFLISPEVLATVAILGAFTLACAGFHRAPSYVDMARTMLVPAVITLAIAGSLLAYPVVLMVAGPEHFSGPPWPIANPYHNDLLSFLVPGPLQRVTFGLRHLGIRLLNGSNASESGGYVGIPLLLLAISLAFRSRQRRRMQNAALALGAAIVFSLGPHLVVDAHLTAVPLPDILLTHVPLLNSILPVRMSFEVDACLAAVIAFGLDDLRRAPGPTTVRSDTSQRTAGILSGILVIVLLVTQFPEWPYRSQPARLLPEVVRQVIPPDDPVAVTYPYPGPFNDEFMLWQAQGSFDFRLLGGYALRPDATAGVSDWPNLVYPPDLQQFLAGGTSPTIFGPRPPLNSHLVTATRQLLLEYDVQVVLVDRTAINSASVIELFTHAIGPPQRSTLNFAVWVNRQAAL